MSIKDKYIPSLVPETYFGVSPEVSGCGTFLDDYTFTHVSGRLLITEDFRTRKQTFDHLPKYGQHLINAVAFDRRRKMIVVADQGKPPMLNVYRLSDHENLLTFIPKDCKSEKFTSMFFHSDCERISALLGPPDNMIYTLHLDQKCVEAMTPGLPKDTITEITQIVGHQEDTFHYAILGIGLLRFVTWMGDIWEDIFHSFNKAEGIPITSGTYTTIDTLLVGTADGKLMLISHDGIKAIFDPLTVESFHIEIKKKGVKPLPTLDPPTGNVVIDGFTRKNEVKFLQSFQRGILYSVKKEVEETIHVMLKGRFGEESPFWIPDTSYTPLPEDDLFPKHGFIKIHVGRIAEYDTLYVINRSLYEITNLAINITGKCIVITFAGRFFMILDVKDDFTPPKCVPLAHMLNVGYNKCPVEHVDSCLLKNVFITAGEKTVKLYDYRKKEVFIVYKFEDYIHSISLHPSGYFGLISFTDRTVLFALQQQTFLPIVEVEIECCRHSLFSSGGDLMIITEETKLRVYSVYSFEQISEIIDGQAGKISGMKLCNKNNHIWTSRASGLLAQTNLRDGIMKYIFPCTPVASFDEYDNFRKIYFTGFDGTIEELDTAERCITQKMDIKHGNLTDIIISKSWNLIILGTETGYIVVLNCPLKTDEPPLFSVKMHYAPIIKIALSKDETYLFSSAKDGSICIWKLLNLDNPDRWDGVYTKTAGYPIPTNYKQCYDHKPIQQLVDSEKDYFSRQEKLMMTSTNQDMLKSFLSLLDCLKSYELRGVLHPPTKFRRFKYKEYWHNLADLGRENVLEEQFIYEKFRKRYYERTQDYMDVYKHFEAKKEEFTARYLGRMKESYEIMKKNNSCLNGVTFHDVKGDIALHIRKQKQFCKLLKEKSKIILKEIEIKGRNYIDMKSSPKYIKYVRKERRIRQTMYSVMHTIIHRKILKLLTLFKCIIEAKKLCNERNKKTIKTDDITSDQTSRNSENESDAFSFLHSEDPSDSINAHHAYLIQNSPENSVSGRPLKNNKIKWPNLKTKRCSKFLNEIKKYRKNKFKHMMLGSEEKLKICNNVMKDAEKLSNTSNKNDSEEKKSTLEDSETLQGDTFVVTKGFLRENKMRRFKSKSYFKSRRTNKLLSKILAQRKKIIKIEAFIKEFEPVTNKKIPIKIPLVHGKYAYLISDFLNNSFYQNTIVKNTKKLMTGISNLDAFPTMYNYFKHNEKFVNQISPFYALKRQMIKSKFREILLNYAPNSKLCKLAVRHLVISKQLYPKNLSIGKNKPNIHGKNLVEYNPFSDTNLTYRMPNHFSNFSDAFVNLICSPNLLFKETKSFENIAPCEKNKDYFDIFNDNIDKDKLEKVITQKKKWEKLCQISYPLEKEPNGEIMPVPTEHYKEMFENVFKRNLSIPKSTLPVLKQLMKGHMTFSNENQRPCQNPNFFPLKDIWILKSINAIKHININPEKNSLEVTDINNYKKCVDETKEKSDLFQGREMKRTYMRTGIQDQLAQERLNYNICHKNKWVLFNPMISKDLMSVLIRHDLLHDLEKSSDKSSSSKSVQSIEYEPGLTHFDENEFTIRPSDTDLLKSYLLDKDKNISKLPDSVRLSTVRRKTHTFSDKSMPTVGDECYKSLLCDKNMQDIDTQELSEYLEPKEDLSSQDSEIKPDRMTMNLFYEVEKSVMEKEKENNYKEYLLNYEMYFSNEALFPVIELGKAHFSELKQIEIEETGKSMLKNQITVDTNVEANKQEVVNLENTKKDGGYRKRLVNNITTKDITDNLLPNKLIHNKLGINSRDRKVLEWLADTDIEIKRGLLYDKTSKQQSIEIIKCVSSSDGEIQDGTNNSFELSHIKKSSKCGRLEKDGTKDNNALRNETERVLWEKLHNITYKSVDKLLSNINMPYNVKLWSKIFGTQHPSTTESFNDICMLKRSNKVQLSVFPEMSFDKIYEKSLPQKKIPEDPSDEIETVSSIKYIIFEDKLNKTSKYSIYAKQNVQIRTNLKNKVWFIPDKANDNSEDTKGKFYYPGDPVWHKGFISPFLKCAVPQNELANRKIMTGSKKLGIPLTNIQKELINIYKKGKCHSNIEEGNFESLQFKKMLLPFGFAYILPFKYKRFWKELEKAAGGNLIRMIFKAMKEIELKNKVQKSKKHLNFESLIVTYNRALLDLPLEFENSRLSKSAKQVNPESCDLMININSTLKNTAIKEISPIAIEETDENSISSENSTDSSTITNTSEKLSKEYINENVQDASSTAKTVHKNKNSFTKKIVIQQRQKYSKSSYVSNKDEPVQNVQDEKCFNSYRLGLEWGLYKNFVNRINKPYILNVVKRFEGALFEWMKLHNREENMHSLKNQQKNVSKPNYELLLSSKQNKVINPILKVNWPECLTKEKKISKNSHALQDVPCPKENLIKLNRKIFKFHRQLYIKDAVTMCAKTHDYIPETNRLKISVLPKDFNLQMLDGNYHILRKINENFIHKRLRKIQNYCKYRAKMRRAFHQLNVRNALYSGREYIHSKNLKKSDEFLKEYFHHRSHLLIWLDKINKTKLKLNKTLKMANDKCDHLQNIKEKVMNIIKMFTFDRNERNIREATKALIQKFAQNSPTLDNKKNIFNDYEHFVINNMKLHGLDKEEEPVKVSPDTKITFKEGTSFRKFTAFYTPDNPNDLYCFMKTMSRRLEVKFSILSN